MVKRHDVSPYFSESDRRVVEACLRKINAEGLSDLSVISSVNEGASIINHAINAQDWIPQTKKNYADQLTAEVKQILIPLEELDWFRKDERACCWVWGKIVNSQFTSAPNHPFFQLNTNQPAHHALNYGQLNLKSVTSSSKERFEEVVKYLDRCCQPLEWQKDLIASMKSFWSQIYTARKPFSWLKQDNEEQIRWAWEYLCKPSLVNKPYSNNFNPTGYREMYLMIYAAFDLWDVPPDSKRLFIGDFNKAWQQKKHRDNRQGKKVCNLVLREDVKKKLDDMAAARNMKLNQFVETLIENEYVKVNVN